MDYSRKATGSAAVIQDAQDRVLLVRRAYLPHDWILPGGNAAPDESPAETVLREVQEELGVTARILALVGVYYQADHRAGEFIHFVFRCSLDGAAALRPDPSEVADYGWYAADALPQPMSDSTHRRLTDALKPTEFVQVVTLPPRSEPPV